MKKITLMLIVGLLTITKLTAQWDSANAAALITAEAVKIQYVFEGTIIKVEQYAGNELGNRLPKTDIIPNPNTQAYTYRNLSTGGSPICYSIATIRICQMYKGTLTSDTVKLVSAYRSTMYTIEINGTDTTIDFNQVQNKSRLFRFNKGMEGFKMIFFTYNHTFSGISNAIKTCSRIGDINFNTKLFNPNSPFDRDKIFARGTGLLYYNNKHLFYSRQEVYNFLDSLPILDLNVHLPNTCEINYLPPSQKKSEDTTGFFLKNQKDYERNLKNYDNWCKNMAYKFEHAKKHRSAKRTTPEELNITMKNPRITGANTDPWLEFDIFVSSNVNYTYFDGCAMWFEYDNSLFNKAFGINVAPANIQITRAPAFNTSSYIDPQLYVTNQANTIVSVPITTDFFATNLNRVNITTTPQKMLTIRIKIQNIDKAAGIKFTDTSTSSGVSYFALTNNGFSIYNYSKPTYYIGENNDRTCMPIISSFNDNVHAGTGEILTIVGKYFGDSLSNNIRSVIFANANKGEEYPETNLDRYGVDNYDMVYWNHDTIKVRIPANIDSITTDITNPDYHSTPGSGKFQIVNRYNRFGESNTRLTIPYAVSHHIEPTNPTYTKASIKLAGINANNGYTLRMTTAFDAAYPEAKAVIKKAMRDWTCKTGINWTLGNNTTKGLKYNDSLSVLGTDPNLTPIAQTEPIYYGCKVGNNYSYFMHSCDIAVNSSTRWEFDTLANIPNGKYDFYEVITHELGHAHLLEHANYTNEIMFWQSNNNGISNSNRNNLDKSPNAEDGGDYVTTNLISATFCSNAHSLVICGSNSSSINSIQNNTNNLTIYPNPISNGSLTIVPKNSFSENTYYIINDQMGREIKRLPLSAINDNAYQIPVDNLTNGIYLLQIISENMNQTAKFIKF